MNGEKQIILVDKTSQDGSMMMEAYMFCQKNLLMMESGMEKIQGKILQEHPWYLEIDSHFRFKNIGIYIKKI